MGEDVGAGVESAVEGCCGDDVGDGEQVPFVCAGDERGERVAGEGRYLGGVGVLDDDFDEVGAGGGAPGEVALASGRTEPRNRLASSRVRHGVRTNKERTGHRARR